MRRRFPTRDAPSRRTTTTGPEESPDAPRPADPPPRRRRRTSAKPPSLARLPKRAKPASRTLSHGPTAETDAPAAAEGRPSGGDGPRRVRRRDGRRPTAVLSKGRTRESGHDPAKPEPDPRPRGGTGQPAAPQPWERCRGGGSEATSTRHTTRATHARDARGEAAVAGTAKTGKRGRDRSRRARTVDGWGPGAHRHPAPLSSRSAPRPDRGAHAPSGERGNRGPAALGRARTRPLRSPPRVTRPRLRHGRHAGVTTRSLAPRGSSPDSERGGAGRSGRQTQTLGFFPPPKTGRGEGHPAEATRIGLSGRAGGDALLIGSLEKTLFLTEGGRDGPGPTSLQPRQRKSRGRDTHAHHSMISSAARRGVCGTGKASLPSRSALLSVRGQGGPGREKAYYRRGPPRARPASPATNTHRVCTRRGGILQSID